MRDTYTKIDGYDDKIKPCPFCGSPSQLWEYSPNESIHQKVVMCTNSSDENAEPTKEGCPLYMSADEFHKSTKTEAIAAWNKREDMTVIYHALECAMALCDSVPTKLQDHDEDYVANIGKLVNEDGYYHLIHQALNKVKLVEQLAEQPPSENLVFKEKLDS